MWTILLVLGTMVSYTRIEKQEKLNFSVKFVESLIENMTEGLVVHAPDGQIVKMNPSAESILAMSMSKALGSNSKDPIWKTYDENDELLSAEKYPSTITQRTGSVIRHFPMKFVSQQTQEIKYIEVNSAPIFGADPKVPQFVVVTITDKTKIKEKELEIKRQESILALNNKMSALGEMASGIAHEINNPLAVISSKLFAIKKRIEKKQSLTDDDLFREITIVENTIARISKIITNMKSLSRNSSNDPLAKADLSLIGQTVSEIVSETLNKFEIKFEICESEPCDILCNAVEIEQVLINLIHNARDAVKNLPEKWIKMKIYKSEGMACVSITDSGSGIPDHIVEKLSQPFFTTEREGEGTGLGLSISRTIAKRHQGILEINKSNKNTELILSIPLITANDLCSA